MLRKKVLLYFFTNPEAGVYVRQLAALLRVDPGNLSKELALLTKEELLTLRPQGNQKIYSLNKKYALYKELKTIVFKTIGIEGYLKDIVRSVKKIKAAFIYGSFAEGKEHAGSDIDLFIIGTPDDNQLEKQVSLLENMVSREINYTIYTSAEFDQRRKQEDSFILNILARDKIMLKGKDNEI